MMANDKRDWAILLTKYVDEEITEEELVELHHLMERFPVLKWQFDRVTAPGYYNECLLTIMSVNSDENLRKGFKLVQKALNAAKSNNLSK